MKLGSVYNWLCYCKKRPLVKNRLFFHPIPQSIGFKNKRFLSQSPLFSLRTTNCKQTLNGFTLIELIVFIVIISIAASILFPILMSLKYSGTLPDQTVAQQLARSRMELILERRHILGFQSISDPCNDVTPPASGCAIPTDYAVSSSIANNWGGNTNYQVVTVQVTGKAQATLTTLVANYD